MLVLSASFFLLGTYVYIFFQHVLFKIPLRNKPLQLWKVITPPQGSGDAAATSWVKMVEDEDLKSQVLELFDDNVSMTRIECPSHPSENLAIGLPFLVLLVKNMKRYFTLEIELVDDTKKIRRFRCSNFQSEPRVKEDICTMPLLMEAGWNNITLDLKKMTETAYGTQYKEVNSVVVHSNTRIRRIFFAETLMAEENLPAEFRLFKPK